MIARKDFDIPGFQEDLARCGWNERVIDIDSSVALASANGRFTEEWLRSAAAKARKDLIRKLYRKGFVDEAGKRVEFLSVREVDGETGAIRRGYKQLAYFNLSDFEYVIRDSRRRIRAERKKYRDLCELASDRFGFEAIQERLDFDLPRPASKAGA